MKQESIQITGWTLLGKIVELSNGELLQQFKFFMAFKLVFRSEVHVI